MAATYAGSFTRYPVRECSSCPQPRQSATENCSCIRIPSKRQGSLTWQSSSRLRNRILDERGKVVRFQPAVRAVSETNDAVPAGTSQGTGEDSPPAGCNRITVELGRPLGLVLEEDKDGRIFVADIVSGGNAAKAAAIEVGDELIATSAVVYNSEMDYGGVKVRKGQEVVRLAVRGERFDTVMAAISTHPAVIKVKLELQKCPK